MNVKELFNRKRQLGAVRELYRLSALRDQPVKKGRNANYKVPKTKDGVPVSYVPIYVF